VFRIPEVPTRTEVLTFISKSASYGNLGLFVGAGFSKAVLNDPMKIALSWGELLEQSAKIIMKHSPSSSRRPQGQGACSKN
jgi:hypothetical protein